MNPAKHNENPVHLQVKNLSKHYPFKGGFFDTRKGFVKAVDDVSFSVKKGQVFGLVGESGCGKTTTGRLIMRVLEPTYGQIFLHNSNHGQINLTDLKNRDMRALREKMQMIFQDPYASLDPRMTVMHIVGEPLRANKLAAGSEYRDRIAEALKMVRLGPDMMNRYPHAFSGGQRQRIGIARALITQPDLVVADEPVSALDVSVQAQILNLLRDLQSQFNLTLLFIAHDLSVIRHMCDVIAVMYLGSLVEVADRSTFFKTPRHPYSELLLDAAPGVGRTSRYASTSAKTIDAVRPSGCRFYPRCPYRQKMCQEQAPPLRTIAPGHQTACYFDLDLKGI
jgi:peptide/nickel transport system ATP-binding protein